MSLFAERLAASMNWSDASVRERNSAVLQGMKNICLIRHGESLANAGAPAGDHETIPLSSFGKEQAEECSKGFPFPADLIITSPYLRARQTMLPTLRRFPSLMFGFPKHTAKKGK